MIILVLAVVMVFAFSTTAFASSVWFPGRNVVGGSSNLLSSNVMRDEQNTMDMSIDILDMHGQTNFRFRGYLYNTNTASTILKTIGGTGTYRASYTTDWMVTMDTKASIASTSRDDYVWFRGSLFV